MKWTVEALDSRVEGEIEALSKGLRARFSRLAFMLREFGPQGVGMPHVRHLKGRLWEMRMKAREGIARAAYVTLAGRRIVVLHVFVKKSSKTPRQALETALRRLKELENG